MLKVNRHNYLNLNPKQRYIVDLIEGWGIGNEKNRDLLLLKEFRKFTVKSIANVPDSMRRVFEVTETEELKHIGDYDTTDPDWKVKVLQDVGILDEGYLEDQVVSHFINKRMFKGK